MLITVLLHQYGIQNQIPPSLAVACTLSKWQRSTAALSLIKCGYMFLRFLNLNKMTMKTEPVVEHKNHTINHIKQQENDKEHFSGKHLYSSNTT